MYWVNSKIHVQVGNYTEDQAYWGRPEDISSSRPYYATPLNVDGASSSAVDLGGAISAALIAAHLALPNAPKTLQYQTYGDHVAQSRGLSPLCDTTDEEAAWEAKCGVHSVVISRVSCQSHQASCLYFSPCAFTRLTEHSVLKTCPGHSMHCYTRNNCNVQVLLCTMQCYRRQLLASQITTMQMEQGRVGLGPLHTVIVWEMQRICTQQWLVMILQCGQLLGRTKPLEILRIY